MILQYSNNVYPMDLFVGTEEDISYAERHFFFYRSVEDLQNNLSIEDAVIKPLQHISGVTFIVRHKKSDIKGLLILLNMSYLKEGDYTFILDTVSHESSHAVDAVYQLINQNSDTYDNGNEPHAYLTGWFAGCIGSYLTKYFKKQNECKEI